MLCVFLDSDTKDIVSTYLGLEAISIGDKYKTNDKVYLVVDKVFNIDMNKIELFVQEIEQ